MSFRSRKRRYLATVVTLVKTIIPAAILIISVIGAPVQFSPVGVASAQATAVIDDFEDGDTSVNTSGWVGWQGSPTITTSLVLEGTTSANITSTNSIVDAEVNRSSASSAQNLSVTLQIDTDTSTGGDGVLVHVFNGASRAFAIEFDDGTGNIKADDGSGPLVDTGTSWTEGTTHTIEARDINWSGNTYDIWLDGSRIADDYGFHTSLSGFDTFRLRTNTQGSASTRTVTFDDVKIGGTAAGGGGGGGTPSINDHTQTFELVTQDETVFPSEGSTLSLYRYEDEDGDVVKVGNPEQDPAAVEYVFRESFNFQNQVSFRLDDGAFYKIVLEGTKGDTWVIDPFLADASGEALWPDPDDDGIVELEPCGPSGCLPPEVTPTATPAGTPTPYPTPVFPGGGGGLPDYPDAWDPDGDGVIDNPPDLENPTFEIPNSTLDQGPYLQTGLFVIGGQRCAGVRYWDPSYSTDSFDYDFSVEGTTYEGTETFDDPIGYYEACVDETQIDPDGTYGSNETSLPSVDDVYGNSTFNFSGSAGSFDFSESFGFGEGGSGGSFGLSGPSSGSAPMAPSGDGGSGGSGLTGLLFLIGGLTGAVAARRALPADRAPELPVIGQVPVSPVTLLVAMTVIGLWITGNVPSIGSVLGFLGLVGFVWFDVLGR